MSQVFFFLARGFYFDGHMERERRRRVCEFATFSTLRHESDSTQIRKSDRRLGSEDRDGAVRTFMAPGGGVWWKQRVVWLDANICTLARREPGRHKSRCRSSWSTDIETPAQAHCPPTLPHLAYTTRPAQTQIPTSNTSNPSPILLRPIFPVQH